MTECGKKAGMKSKCDSKESSASENSAECCAGKARLLVRQVRSANGRDKRTLELLASIGLGRIGNCQELPNVPSIHGAIGRVRSLLSVEELA